MAASALGLAQRMGGAVEVPSTAMETPATPDARVAFLVVDERFDAADALARSLMRNVLLAPTSRISMPRDVLALWNSPMADECRNGTHAFAGVATERGFFLLSTLAADHRLKVLYRESHAAQRGAANALTSFIIGPRALRG